MENHRPILLNVPLRLLQRLDVASKALSVSRSELIRNSLARDLDFVLGHEVPRLAKARENAAGAYASWLKEAG